jgi:hypothetical protein
MEGFHTRERPVVGLFHPQRELKVRVWANGEEGFAFILAEMGAHVAIQTRRAGIEAIRDACNDALVRTDD